MISTRLRYVREHDVRVRLLEVRIEEVWRLRTEAPPLRAVQAHLQVVGSRHALRHHHEPRPPHHDLLWRASIVFVDGLMQLVW